MSDAPAEYHPSPYPDVGHRGARHRASGGRIRVSGLGWIILGVAIVTLAALGVLFAL